MGSYEGNPKYKYPKGASNAKYSRQLLKVIGIVDGLVNSDVEAGDK